MNKEQELREKSLTYALKLFEADSKVKVEHLIKTAEVIKDFINGDDKISRDEMKEDGDKNHNFYPPNYLTLYEYLGRPAGKELGSRVHNFSLQGNIDKIFKRIETKNYSGEVSAYPIDFLDDLFPVLLI